MIKKPLLIMFTAFCIFSSLYAQKIAELHVPLTGRSLGVAIPVHINLDEITFLPESEISLIEIRGKERIEIPYQIENRGQRILYWLIQEDGKALNKRTYELIKAAPQPVETGVNVSKKHGKLVIHANQKSLLQYNYKTHYPPEGVDTAFRRSGFIHPLWTPKGQPLTRIDAPDHYHHYGLWNPWTKVLFEGQTVDFWNLKEKQGTVRFTEFISVNEGPVYGDYQTLHDHVAFLKGGVEKTALNELQSVRIYQPKENQDYYLADISIQLNCASESPVLLQEYRYGGLGWRATEKWNKENSETLTSEGKTRKDADGSNARWVIVQGSLDDDYGGALMMSFPTNFNHPEPLRIWPENANGRGDVYANFSPTKDKDWALEPGKDYLLKYRFLVFNGKLSEKKAEAIWQSFAHPPKVSIKVLPAK